MTYSLHPEAERDIADALDFYIEHASGVVAMRFLEAFERVATLIAGHPSLGTPTTRGRRMFPLKKGRSPHVCSIVGRVKTRRMRINKV